MNKTYTIYDSETGSIKRTIKIDEDLLEINVHDGESYVVGESDNKLDTHYINGEFTGAPTQEELDEIALQQSWIDFRYHRDLRLTQSDWTVSEDSPVDKEAWKTYRQALRDLPENVTDPTDVTWPTPPV